MRYLLLVARPKNKNTKCATLPYRTLMISRKVCALGALRLSSMAKMANNKTYDYNHVIRTLHKHLLC